MTVSTAAQPSRHAVKENPALAEETISVLLFNYESRERVQQMFSDLNRFVMKTSKSLDILYDKRDPVSQATLRICELVPVFQGMVDKDAVSIGVRSPKLLSLSALYDATQELFRANAVLHDEETSVPSLVQIGREFWQAVSDAMPDWQKVKAEAPACRGTSAGEHRFARGRVAGNRGCRW